MPFEAYVALSALAGAILGLAVVPALADLMLVRKLALMRRWWDEAGALYRDFRVEHPDLSPRAGARGDEGAAGIWFEEVARAIRSGSITIEQAAKARKYGVTVDGPARMDAEDDERYRFRPRPEARAILAAAMTATFAAIAIAPMPPVASGCLATAACAVAVCVVCDIRARLIPIELCLLIAIVGIAYRFAMFGAGGVVAAILAGACVAALCAAVNQLLGRGMSCARPVGSGDVRLMVALTILCGPRASMVGALACYGAALATSLAMVAARKKKLSDALPMAPFLALWAAVGVASSLGAFSA